MYNIIAGIGSYLVKKFGVSVALSWLYASARVLQFTLITSMFLLLINVISTIYFSVKSIIEKITSFADGSFSGGSDCLAIISSSLLEAIGFIDAWNTIGPSIFIVIFAYFNFHLFMIVYKIHGFITSSISHYASTLLK